MDNRLLMSLVFRGRPARAVRRGVSLIELITVIAVLGVIMGLVFPHAAGTRDSARRAVALEQAAQIQSALDQWVATRGSLAEAKDTWNTSDNRLGLIGGFLHEATAQELTSLSSGDSNVVTAAMSALGWQVRLEAWNTGSYPKAALYD